MSELNQCLSDSALAAIARNELDDVELQSCERHLEWCGSCREQLEMRSADAVIWQSARTFLLDDDFDQQRFGCEGQTANEKGDGAAQLLKFLAPTDDPHMLGRLGSYEVSGIVGAGGMGIVLKAFEPSLARFVALKVLAPSFWKDHQARERFAREARAAASIVDDNVIEIYGVDEVNEIPFFAMPYLRGDTLQARIDRQGPFRTEEILRVAMQVASGLAAAHAQGLVHRDIKPANILLGTGADRVRITDFGIVRSPSDPNITQSGFVAGTPQFMSPEQVRGESIDGRSDLFSLGSVMYAMCAGRPPFQANSNYELLHKIVSSEFAPLEEMNPAIPDWLAAIVAKLLRPAPADRFQSAAELAQQLEQCLASLQHSTSRALPKTVTRLEAKYRRQRRSNSRRILLGGLVMCMCLGSIAIMGFAFLNGQATDSDTAKSIVVRGQVVNDQGAPISGVTVLAVQKTWPNDRYQQQMLKTATDDKGDFQFKEFAVSGRQYAFLLTVISDQWLMTSEYRLVKDGAQQEPVVMRTSKSQPVTIRFVDAAGRPVTKVSALPSGRFTKDGKQYLSYAQQVRDSGVLADNRGEVRFGSWLPGEKGSIDYLLNDEIVSSEFTVADNRSVTVIVPTSVPNPPTGPPIHVDGRVVDAAGKPVGDVQVWAIQKTWPQNRYRQDSRSTKTDAEGRFRFEKFATARGQYAFLVTVLAEGYAMTSEYQLVEDGSQKGPITLKLEPSEPVTIVVKDAAGNPLEGVEVSPAERKLNESTSFLNYSMHMKDTAKKTDVRGEVSFTAWRPGESAKVYYRRQDQVGELQFQVSDSRRATISIPNE